jgi:hypothetical protein
METPSRQDLIDARQQRDERARKVGELQARLDELRGTRRALLDAGDEDGLARLRAELREAEDAAVDAAELLDRSSTHLADLERACAPRWQALHDAVAVSHAFAAIETDEHAARALQGARTLAEAHSFLHGQAELIENADADELTELSLRRVDGDAAREGARRVLRFWCTRRTYEMCARAVELLGEMQKFARVLDAELTRHADEAAAVGADVGAETLPTLNSEALHAAAKTIAEFIPAALVVTLPTPPAREPADSPTPRRRGLFGRGEEARA